ncbi:mycothione reductase [Jongsikchunia kroppenstedtii]|uniref:mycothione reductase n=1 Tax=Jongsikchunia kroppenstedtii TaxID=1121721 RepID=UPI00037C4CB4|nr:mycothione reductase [Jongsikchunia kroppenstedtii]
MNASQSAPNNAYDLIIVGSGSGNSIPDSRFDDWSIAIVDQGTFGGTCLNVGCIPTKMFVYPADRAADARDSSRLGVDCGAVETHWEKIRDRVFGRVDAIAANGLHYRQDDCDNIDVYQQHAQFVAPRDDDTGLIRLRLADGTILAARRVVLAAGSRPAVPPAIAHSGATFHTNDTIMRLPRLPEHIVIVGSGAIAAEFAHVFGDLGSRVTVVARGDHFLRSHDETVSARFTEIATARWDVRFSTEVVGASDTDDGVDIELSDGSRITADVMLVATGRIPNGDRLDLAKVGLTLDDSGRVPVDRYQRTAAHNIYALGDVSSPYMLKHVANHESRVAARNLLDYWDSPTAVTDHRAVPDAVFTWPQVAAVGLTEAQAREAGLDIAVAVKAYGDVAYGWAMDDSEGLCKLIADRHTGTLVGAHIVGEQASTLIQTPTTAMSFDIPVADLARGQYWPHPALQEVIENALLELGLDNAG